MRRLFIAATAIAALSGCASIVSESRYPVEVTSHPPESSFEIRNERGSVVTSGVTPGRVILDAGAGYFNGETYLVTYRKDGYADQTAALNSEIDGWYWANIVLGGLVGMLIVDPATGAMYKLPSHVGASLTPTAPPLAIAPSADTPEKSKDSLLEELANDKSISYEEYRRRHEIIMRSN